MPHRFRSRYKAHLGAVVALGLLPWSLTTSQPVANTTAPAPQREHAAVVAWTTATAVAPSRSSSRFSLLEQPGSSFLVLDAARVGATKRNMKVSSPKGTRTWSASAMSDHNVPAAAVRAYRNAARTMAGEDPSCQLPWTLLAGIGKVESDHGRYGGATLARDGVSHPLIIGIALNGAGPVAAIRDSDNGRLDKDKVWDRAVGPMQFIPTTWANAARDGDRNGVKTPNDIDDAALAAAAYLCSGSGSVLGEAAMGAAVYRYNQDGYYVALVLALERGYRTGVFIIPSPPVPEEDDSAGKRGKKKHKKHGDQAGDNVRPHRPAGTKGAATADPKPSPAPKPPASPSPTPKPTPKPSPKPKPPPTSAPPAPSGPELSGLTGAFNKCDAASGWCLDGTPLDLGPVVLGETAAHDFDDDPATVSNADEFEGLAAAGQTTLSVEQNAGVAVVYVINGEDYRFADGSLA
jgi:membrane-bound lytic murein transglycosylase B